MLPNLWGGGATNRDRVSRASTSSSIFIPIPIRRVAAPAPAPVAVRPTTSRRGSKGSISKGSKSLDLGLTPSGVIEWR